MDTYHPSYAADAGRLKTVRRRTRLRKEGADKKLRHMGIRQQQLYDQRRHLPLVPLETPYQKGWKRSFILREDVARSKAAPMYAHILETINTTVFSKDKAFIKKKRRKRGRGKEPQPQFLKELTAPEWHHSSCGLTVKERLLFRPKEVWNPHARRYELQYVFSEPWRYVLRIRPHMITHKKMIDAELESDIDLLENHIERCHLRPKIYKVLYGGGFHRWRDEQDIKNVNPLHNKPLYCILAELKEDHYQTYKL